MSTSSRPWLPFVFWTAAVVLALLLATMAVRVPTRSDEAVAGTPWPTLPSATPRPPTATATATPAVLPGLPAAIDAWSVLPPLPAELCFERDGAILCWPKAGVAIATVWAPSGDGWRFALRNEDYEWVASAAWDLVRGGTRLVMAQSRDDPSAGGAATSRFLVVDRDRAGSIVSVPRPDGWPRDRWRQGDGLEEWSADPTGARLAYVQRAGRPDNDAPSDAAHVVAVDLMYVGDVLTASPARTVATCRDEAPPAETDVDCYGVSLSPGGGTLAMSDADGLSLIDVATLSERRVAMHFNRDDDGLRWRVHVPREWSPDGRWLHVGIGHYEGSSEAWIDPTDGTMREVPNSSSYAGIASTLAFGADRIAHTHYNVHDDSGHVAVLDARSGELWRTPEVLLGGASTAAFSPVVVGDEIRFGMRRSLPGGPSEHGIFALPLGEHATEPRRLLSLPADVVGPHDDGAPGDLRWAADGSAFVLLGVVGEDERDVVLVGTQGADGWRLIDASAVLDGARGVRWSGR